RRHTSFSRDWSSDVCSSDLLAVRAIAGDDEIQVAYSAGRPELDGKTVQLPEPSRVPSAREVAVIRGWADSLALTAAVHDKKVHQIGSASWRESVRHRGGGGR